MNRDARQTREPLRSCPCGRTFRSDCDTFCSDRCERAHAPACAFCGNPVLAGDDAGWNGVTAVHYDCLAASAACPGCLEPLDNGEPVDLYRGEEWHADCADRHADAPWREQADAYRAARKIGGTR